DHREAEPLPQLPQQVDDRALREDVERGRRLVEDDDLGLEHERERDEHPLLHPARQLVRKRWKDPMRVEMHEVEELGGPIVDAMLVLEAVSARGVEELLPDADDRVERVERSLEDHGAFGPAVLAEVIGIEAAD